MTFHDQSTSMEPRYSYPIITFSEEDLIPRHCMGDNPLVIIADIGSTHGRPTMKQLGAIASTLHSIMKFPTQDGIVFVRGETLELMCNQISRKRDRSSEDQFQNEENDEETIVINEAYPEQKITIGKNLPRRLKHQLSELLRSNIDIFAWTPADMTGIVRELAKHRLNIHPRTFPVWQKK
ncbi:hypothetical protein Tco_0762779 [Tanacetum coccineum]